MGGRIAEELIFDQMTTGAGNDIERGDRAGAQDGVRVGHEREARARCTSASARARSSSAATSATRRKEYSEETAVEIDAEVRRIVTANYERAKKVVVDNVDKLKALAEALLEYETLDGAEIDMIFAGQKLDRKLPPTAPSRASAPKAAEKPPRPSIFAPPRPVPDKA